MSKPRFAPVTFSIAYCCAYVLVLAADLPLFLYYPLRGDFVWAQQPLTGAGPSMAWYGLTASAGIIALLAALLIPDRVFERGLRNLLWLVPVAAVAACTFLMRFFFLLV